MFSSIPSSRALELPGIDHADHAMPGTPDNLPPSDGLRGTRRGSSSSRGSSRRSGSDSDRPGAGGVTESELEDDLKRLLSLMDDAEEAVELQQKAKKQKSKSRKKVGPPTCSGAWWGARKRRPLTLAVCNNLFLVVAGFFLSAFVYDIDTTADAGTLDVQRLRADGLTVRTAKPVLLQSNEATSATVRAPKGKPTVVRLGESTFGSVGGGRGLALEPGGESWAGGSPGPGGMLAIGDVYGDGEEGSSLDMTLTSAQGALRVGPFVLTSDTVENHEGDLVLQSAGGAGGMIMLTPDGTVETAANVTVAGSLSVDGLRVNVGGVGAEYGVEVDGLEMNAVLEAERGVTVRGDLMIVEGLFAMAEGMDMNVSGALSVGGSVTMTPPDPETSNRTGSNLTVLGALRVRGERGVTTTTLDAVNRQMHSVGGIQVEVSSQATRRRCL